MNNIIEQDEIFTNIEPQISYYSSSLNCGVTAIFSKNEKKLNNKINELYIPFSPKNNFSLCNTIMLPFIINENLIDNKNNNINQSLSISKDKELNHISQTRNMTETSKNEYKENDDTLNEKTKNQKEYLNTENNSFLIGKNLSTNYNYINKNEESNEKCNNENINKIKNQTRYSKIEGDFKDYMSKEQCRSVNINEICTKKSILKDSNNVSKKRLKKAKIKNCYVDKKNNKIKKDQQDKRKSFFSCHKQTKDFIDEPPNKEFNKRLDNQRKGTSKLVGDKKTKNFYYSHKLVNKNYNENFFKIIIKQNNFNKFEDKGNKSKEKIETKKPNRKVGNKTPFRETNINSKLLKLKFKKIIKNYNDKINGHKLSQCFQNKDKDKKEKKDESSNESNINLDKDNNVRKEKKEKLTKVKPKKEKKNSNLKEKNDIRTKTSNSRESEFSFKKIIKGKNSENGNDGQITFKALKNSKEKDNNSKSKQSLKENITRKKLNYNLSRKELIPIKNNLSEEKKNVNATPILRRKRSISMNFGKSKLKEIAEAMKHKKKSVDDMNYYLANKNMDKIKKKNKLNIDFESALKKNSKKMQFNLFSKDKFTNTEFNDSDYLEYTLDCMELMLKIDKDKQVRLKNKINFNFPKPRKNGIKKKIALFDLDETLVHCTGDINKKKGYQHSIEIKLPGKQAVQVGINIRPHWKQTLNLIKKHYHIVVYTASHQAYADSVLDFMDPKKKYFKYRLYRNNCSLIDVEGSKFYVKDLDILNEHYDLKDVVIIDNSVLSFAYHLHNGIPIVPYYDEDKDGSLYVVGLYLMYIFPENDLREANKKQINLDSFLKAAKREKEDIINEEIDGEEDENCQNIETKEDNKEIESEANVDHKGLKKISDKILLVNLRKRTFISKFPIYKRKQSHDFTQKKLISQSKLINMYYEINNNESCKTMQQDIRRPNEEDHKSSDKFLNNKSKTNHINNEKDITNCIMTPDGHIICKSEPNFPTFKQINYKNISDNESNSDEEVPIIKRGYTIIEDNSNNENNDKNNLKGKLKFIRSNFYNKFKI